MTPEIICVDMDGTLCEGTAWTEADVPLMKPRDEVIAKVNALYDHNFIVIYTARRDFLIHQTLHWLDKHGVKYHAFSNKKIPANKYIDDHAESDVEFLKRSQEEIVERDN